jgi:ATP-dependent RNA helicase DDX46/PRP5
MFASRKRVTDVTTPVVVGAVVPGAQGQPMIAPNVVQAPSASNQQKLELAKRLASQINMARNLGPEADNTQQVAAAIMRGDMSAPQISVTVFPLNSMYHFV